MEVQAPESITAIIVAGFSMGIAGSLHCVGMCGPLVAAVFHSRPKDFGLKLIYNGSRIFIYVALGVIAGVLGYLLDIAAVQKYLSLLLGITLVIFGFLGIKKFIVPAMDKALAKFTHQIKYAFGKWIAKRGALSSWILGSLNGLLPCGLTYMALAYTLTLPGSVTAGLFMFSFGAGTLPAMLGIPVLLGTFGSKYNSLIRKLNAAILIALGVLLIWRSYLQFQNGMNSHMH